MNDTVSLKADCDNLSEFAVYEKAETFTSFSICSYL